ncbi:MAG: histidinol-phosphatase [Firmicutes bacterium]|nr:histidinol-phosphatase [Bacillota bacterium]
MPEIQNSSDYPIPLCDYHVHTLHSPDCRVSMDERCKAAIASGIEEICFTDHIEFDPRDPAYKHFNFEDYKRDFEECQKKWGDRLSLRMGVEVNYFVGGEEEILEFLAGKGFDFVLGSYHWLGDIPISPELFDQIGPNKTCEIYFHGLLKAAESGLFDSLAHFDLPKRYAFRAHAPFPVDDFRDIIVEILRRMVEKGTALEINTSGLRTDLNETLPGREIIELYHQLGGRTITIGSDSHRLHDLGFGMDRALDLARRAGFSEVATFKDRKMRLIPIEEPRKEMTGSRSE